MFRELPDMKCQVNGSYLKNVFWPNLFVCASCKILKIPMVFLRFNTRPRRDLEPKSYF